MPKRIVACVVALAAVLNFFSASFSQAATGNILDADTSGLSGQQYFAVTLRSDTKPISDKQAQRDFPNYTIYLVQGKAFDRPVHHVRVGFFEDFSDAKVFRQKALSKYPAAWVTEVSRQEFAAVSRTPTKRIVVVRAGSLAAPVPKPAPPAKPAPAPAPAPSAPAVVAAPISTFSTKALYAVLLETKEKTDPVPRAPLPESLKDRRLYIAQAPLGDKVTRQLKLGFFENEEEVFSARREMRATYPNATVVRVALDEQRNSFRTALAAPSAAPPIPAVAAPSIPAPAPVPVPTPTPAPSVIAKPAPVPIDAIPPPMADTSTVPPSAYDAQAQKLFETGRAALSSGQQAKAIQALDQVLRLPPNRYSKDAQEYIGLARERAGETTAARKEYELYLRLYPEGEGADRVRQRLATFDAAASQTAAAAAELKPVAARTDSPSTIFGSLSQYYYHGASKVDQTTVIPGTNTAAQSGFNETDQNSLITNLDFSHRYRTKDFDNRFVLRNTLTNNFLPDQEDVNRLTDLYYELKDRKRDYSMRLGRQPGSSSGVLNRFDGLAGGYGLTPKWRWNVVGGLPVDVTYNTDVQFYGTSMDLGTFAEHWNTSVYLIKQEADGVTDRQAVGGELRYFDPTITFFSLYDYDTEFQVKNTSMAQLSWTPNSVISVHAMYDQRLSPAIQLTNALIGEQDTSIESQLRTRSYDELKTQAINLTPESTLYGAGGTITFSPRWQYTLDLQTAHISGTAGSATQPAQPDQGDTNTYTNQVIATGIFADRDVTVFGVSLIDGPTYAGESYTLTSRTLLGIKWNFDLTLRYYTQSDSSSNTDLERLSPTLRIGYKWKDNILFETEYGEESSHTQSPAVDDKSHRRFWSLGYRWDF